MKKKLLTFFVFVFSLLLSTKILAQEAPGSDGLNIIDSSGMSYAERNRSIEVFPTLTNYPNPVSTTTTIKFTVALAGEVSLKMYNSAGAKITSIFEGYKNAGTYQVSFNASLIAGGSYVCRLNFTSNQGNIAATRMINIIR